VLGDFAGEFGALLLHVAGRRRRVVEQFLDLVQRRAPGENSREQPDHGHRCGGKQDQAQAQRGTPAHVAESLAMT
jgi:hypothetical protein